MPKETLNDLNKQIVNLRNIADSIILVIDPEFKHTSILMRKYCVVKYVETIAKYNNLIEIGSSNHYGSLVRQREALEEIIFQLKDLLEKSGTKKSVIIDVGVEPKTKKLK